MIAFTYGTNTNDKMSYLYIFPMYFRNIRIKIGQLYI
jgi:hypothetical protein